MRSIAILGDSYSTYAGVIPEDYISWYSDDGNAQENDVESVNDTWWKILCDKLNLDLILNSSYSGSAVCYTGYPGFDGIKTSFVYRMHRDFGALLNQHVVPDFVFIFGGTNDFWNHSPLGEICYGVQQQEKLQRFAPAFCHIMEFLNNHFPQSELVAILNDDITSSIRDTEREVCQHFGVHFVELKDIDKQSGHPSKMGMRKIAEQIKPILLR